MKKFKLVTHSGTFHPDDIFACASLFMMLGEENCELVRTRDEAHFVDADFVFDVGGVYDAKTNRFDHHQIGRAGMHEEKVEGASKVPYASFGLVWKKFGEKICGSAEIAQRINEKLILPVDAQDNGVSLFDEKIKGIKEYAVNDVLNTFLPSWNEVNIKTDDRFIEAVHLAIHILKREIVRMNAKIIGGAKVMEAYQNSKDKRIIELPGYFPWKEVLNKFPEPLVVVTPREDGKYQAETVPDGDPSKFIQRIYFPKSWSGLREEEFAKVSGVPDVVFCHTALFFVVAKTRDGVLRLAELALQQ